METHKAPSPIRKRVRRSLEAYRNTRLITPRFVPSCTMELMTALGELAARYDLPVQSHLSENVNEIKWVKELHPDCDTYSDVYDRCGLFGQQPTLMAHCVYLTDYEMELVRERGIVAVHCPQSNINISSGIAPVRRMLDRGIKVGLGTDVAGGFSISMFRAVADAIQASKMYAVLVDRSQAPLTLAEVFTWPPGRRQLLGSVAALSRVTRWTPSSDDSDIKGHSPLTLAQGWACRTPVGRPASKQNT